MYATLVKQLPEGNEWQYEIKLDGYRCLTGRSQRGVVLWSRRQNGFTAQFPNIARACQKLPPDTLLDGEVVALDENGRVSFNLLQNHRSGASAIRFYAFDMLMCRGRSLLNVPLHTRRELLAEVLPVAGPDVHLSETFDVEPADLIRAASEMEFEGIVAKRKDSIYESGKRNGAWLKYKLHRSQAFVIGGYTPGYPFDALLVGCYEGGQLLFTGKVRNGFVPHVRAEVARRFKGMEIDTCPFANLPLTKRPRWPEEELHECLWLKPELVAEIEFAEWTSDRLLRHSRFVRLREDKDGRQVVREE
jgi:DNA ligase D-like protein (predicted ligase)